MKNQGKTVLKAEKRTYAAEARSQRGVYMLDEIWDKLQDEAEKQDRSLNYILEKHLMKTL